jgi:chromosome segregation ATPase
MEGLAETTAKLAETARLLSTRIDEVNSMRDRPSAPSALEQQVFELRNALLQADDENSILRHKLIQYESNMESEDAKAHSVLQFRVEQLEKKLQLRSSEVSSLLAQIRQLRSEHNFAQSELLKRNKYVDQLEKKIMELENMLNVNELRQQETLQEINSIKDEFLNQITEMSQKLAQSQREVNDLSVQLSNERRSKMSRLPQTSSNSEPAMKPAHSVTTAAASPSSSSSSSIALDPSDPKSMIYHLSTSIKDDNQATSRSGQPIPSSAAIIAALESLRAFNE